MFSFFKKKTWRPATLEEMHGEHGGINVIIRNFPYREDEASTVRHFAYGNFGADFLEALHKELGEHASVKARSAAGLPNTAIIQLKSLPKIEVVVSGEVPASIRSYHSDLADALLSAFENNKIRP